ncbi:MAG: DUF6494 family protein [Marinovum algicola]|jgi:hypothetical protein|uniref:Uncharacterized protein n=1 Tax=Marinovum algicola TaxID=42444 RepID=A0A975WD62_9RHOB|nr:MULTISPECIES: DUF6494 family protein [Marinovum]AKO99891.1 hypothetical protein MALG_04763 [Marinovum algicola DG 898]MDD9739445.1 DUF6494 family protein [Marinovum sp. SP66]MDD9744869.1 DUF6494 family protein [Marinovum sp. PR37]SEJ98589.1 hypothetical protein SAMN04487940_11676 [Marinovum algicola]SLN70550.1 hypothetical protein MAA5396_03883 [Marinovum algicola]
MSDDFNMSMRKFLKQVGVTSQQAIEEAMREADTRGKTYAVKAVVTIEELDLTHEVTGQIKGQE